MKQKSIHQVIRQPRPHHVGDGFVVSNYIPGPAHLQQETSPFVLLDYNSPYVFQPSEHKKGVGAHPHRGFETVTIVYEGEIQHRDSAGNGGTVHADEVQWMTAASGVLHEEFQSEEFSRQGGTQHVVQLWVNLPSQYKMSAPGYQTLTKANIPEVTITKGAVRVIAGEFQGHKGGAKTFSPLHVLDVRLQAGGKTSFDFPPTDNTVVLATKGQLKINSDKVLENGELAIMDHNGPSFEMEALEDAYALVLSGEPLNEPIASYGPFVMNTKDEIYQAIEDFNSGQFGELKTEGFLQAKTMKQANI